MTHAFAPLIENGGVRWLDLAPNGCTVYYTSAGANVERYDVCTGTQLPNLNSSPLLDLTSGAALLGIRVTPDGGAMVSATFDVRRLDASGNPVGTPYKVVNDNGLSGVWLDRDGTSFWVASFETGTVYKFDIATHGVLLEFSTGVQAKGIVVVPPPATTPAQPPAPTPVPGRMTGGGTFAASDGTIVSDGFQLRCDVRDPGQNLEVNWGKGQKFHLDTVTTVTCIKDPAIKAADPGAPFDTMVLTGTGNLHGKDRATISLTFTDAGQPGTNDGVQMVITDTDGNTVLNVPATTLISGDQQAHRATGK
jgi:type 1 fimbria pilin